MRTIGPERAASPNEQVEHPAWLSCDIQQHVLCRQTLMPAIGIQQPADLFLPSIQDRL